MLDLNAIKTRWWEQLLQEQAWRLEEERDGDALANIVIYDHLDRVVIDVNNPTENGNPWFAITDKEFLELAVQAPRDIRVMIAELESVNAERDRVVATAEQAQRDLNALLAEAALSIQAYERDIATMQRELGAARAVVQTAHKIVGQYFSGISSGDFLILMQELRERLIAYGGALVAQTREDQP